MATSPDQTAGTALQRATTSEITTPAQYESHLRIWQSEHAHILSPAVSFSDLPPQSALVASKIKLNPDVNGGDVYQDNFFLKGQDVAIAKIGLSKIAQCAGISVETERMDSRTVPSYWEVRATAKWIGFDGTPQSCQGTVEYDLRDGSARLKGFTASQIEQARKHGLAGAESRAINRAIRQFGVKQKYTKSELEKPFVVVRVVFRPDMSDPVQRAIVTQQRMQGTTALYPHGGTPLPPPDVPFVEGETIPERTAAPVATSTAQPKTAAAEIETLPAPETVKRYTITRVAKQAQDGQTRFFICTDLTLDSLLEAPEPIAMAAAEAKKGGRQVELDLERTDQGMRVLELREVGPAADLPADARFVAEVREKSGKTNGHDWRKFTVVFTDGTEASTFSASIAKDARDAKAGNLPVRATLTTSEKYPDQQNVEELSIIDTRQGSLPMTTEL